MTDVPPDQPADVTVTLGDPAAHAHVWKTNGVDEAGLHSLVCECGETGQGYGTFEATS